MNNKRIIKKRLVTLYEDLTMSGARANQLMDLVGKSNEDMVTLLNDVYFRENSPVKRIQEEFMPGTKSDMTNEMIELSMGFDVFTKSLGKMADAEIRKHTGALKLFLRIMNLPIQLSEIIYLRYLKFKKIEEICETLAIHPSTYHRLLDKAVGLLADGEDDDEICYN